jgi:hypothetical protein
MKITQDRLSVGLVAFLLSSKSKKTWDCKLKHLFSSSALIQVEKLWDRASTL